MIKDDAIYQTLLRHDFNLFRGEMTVSKYLAHHLYRFQKEISDAVKAANPFLGDDFAQRINGELEYLTFICEEIPLILSDFDEGHINRAYQRSGSLFDLMQQKLIYYSLTEKQHCFYRIRRGYFPPHSSTNSKDQKAELFHIKKQSRSRIGAYRYSVAGHPCLYIASGLELAWLECGMPKTFRYCKMDLTASNTELRLINLAERPVDFLSAITPPILNKQRLHLDASKEHEAIIKYILTYPLAAACSVQVKDRGCQFVEEYVFPQLLMQWIRETTCIDGVCYKSSLHTKLVDGVRAFNIALPVKSFREDGLDKHLAETISISDIGYLDVCQNFKKYTQEIEALKKFERSLELCFIQASFASDYIYELLDICDLIIKAYSALMDGNYTNSDLLFSQLSSIFDHAQLLYSCREQIIDNCISQASTEKKPIDRAAINKHFDDFWQLTQPILSKHAAFDLDYEDLGNFELL